MAGDPGAHYKLATQAAVGTDPLSFPHHRELGPSCLQGVKSRTEIAQRLAGAGRWAFPDTQNQTALPQPGCHRRRGVSSGRPQDTEGPDTADLRDQENSRLLVSSCQHLASGPLVFPWNAVEFKTTHVRRQAEGSTLSDPEEDRDGSGHILKAQVGWTMATSPTPRMTD